MTTEVIVPPIEYAEIQTCIKCPLPDCIPYSNKCPLHKPLKSGEKVCPVCGDRFPHLNLRYARKYCSDKCRFFAYNRRKLGKDIRRPVDRLCIQCDKPIDHLLPTAKFCSPLCRRQYNYRQYELPLRKRLSPVAS